MSLLAITLATMAACTQLQYVAKSDGHGGYSETQLAPNTFDVHYSGTGWHDPERISDFLLLRSAELCDREGFSHFENNSAVSHQTTNVSGSLIFNNPVPGPSIIRVICYNSAKADSPNRLESYFVAQKLREKYQLGQ